MDKRKSILIFGLGFLQKSLIEECKDMDICTVGIDPSPNAFCRDIVDVFEVIDGQDYNSTLSIARKYCVSGVITVATDKPLVMMSKVAKELSLPFYSEDTALWSTDKLLMKKRFELFGIPCAKGLIVSSVSDFKGSGLKYPVIVKPRDNSGSRGVIYCSNEFDLGIAITESLRCTNKNNVLIEEYIEGKEYSIESVHYKGKTHVVQMTEKITTEFPYNVELGHVQPAILTTFLKNKIVKLINDISVALKFDNCGSHTELKIGTHGGITIIETSPRLGGDFITSVLVPLSAGVDIERLLVQISIGEKINPEEFLPSRRMCSGIVFFELRVGEIISIENLDALLDIVGCNDYVFNLRVGDNVNKITSSLNRYGWAIFCNKNRSDLLNGMDQAKALIKKCVKIC